MSNIDLKAVSRNFSGAADTYNYWAGPQKVIAGALVKKITQIMELPNNILDMGCGTGYVIDHILKHRNTNTICGIDIAKGMISYCNDKWINSPNVSFTHGDITQFTSETAFDLITSSCALQWIVQIEQAFKNIFSNLTANGNIALAILIDGSFYELLESYKKCFGTPMQGIDYRTDSFYKNILIKNDIEILLSDTESVYGYYYGYETLKYFKNIGATFRYNCNYTSLSVKDIKGLIDAYQSSYANKDGMLPMSHKVLYLIGRKI